MLSVGIPTVNGPHRLERCLSHIFKDNTVKRFNIEIIVVDDGSSDENLNKNREFCNKLNVQFIEHNARRGVPTAWNALVKAATNEYVILLNDDIEVMRHWADVVIYTLSNNLFIGAVGLNTYDGLRKEMPLVPNYNESKIMFGSKNHPLLSSCGSAFAFRKSDWLTIGGFDERYFCFYEEIDFCLSLLSIGKRSAMLSYPILHHYVAETTTTVLSNPQQIMDESELKFENKWNTKWVDIRKLYNSYTMPSISEVNEWNSTLSSWL